MEIKTYNSNQLNDLIHSEAFRNMPVIPISTHRAISHIHNPRAEPTDTLMIIAYENDEMVGYLGVLADRIYPLSGDPLKCGWLSCMWVNPVLRGKGIAKQLLATAFKTWNDHILVTEFTPEAKVLYDRSGNFDDFTDTYGLRCYRRVNLHEVLPKKNEKYKQYCGVLKMIDSMANIPVDIRLSLIGKKTKSAISFVPTSQIDEQTNNYIISKQSNSFERRCADDINWVLQYPWLKASLPTGESKRYHFSSVADRFENICFKLIDKGLMSGYLHFTIRDNHLKLPYAYFEAAYLPDIIQHVYRIMDQFKLNMFTVFHPDIVEYLYSHDTPFIYKRSIPRHYIITKSLGTHFRNADIDIQDGDADCVFT